MSASRAREVKATRHARQLAVITRQARRMRQGEGRQRYCRNAVSVLRVRADALRQRSVRDAAAHVRRNASAPCATSVCARRATPLGNFPAKYVRSRARARSPRQRRASAKARRRSVLLSPGMLCCKKVIRRRVPAKAQHRRAHDTARTHATRAEERAAYAQPRRGERCVSLEEMARYNGKRSQARRTCPQRYDVTVQAPTRAAVRVR